MKKTLVAIIAVAVTAVLFMSLISLNKTPKPTEVSLTPVPTATTSDASCQTCGPQGIHNVEGNVCPEGYVCKSGITTTASYCVKEGGDVSMCESSQEGESVQ